MDEKKIDAQETVGVDLHRAMAVLWRKAVLILLVALIGGVGAWVATKMLVTPQYRATAMFYVNNSAESLENASQSISSSDISAGKSLVDSYLVILKTNATLKEIIEYAGVDYDCQTLSSKISAAPVNSTAIFAVTVESSSPQRAARVADAIAHVLPGRIAGIIEGSSAIVVDDPVVPRSPSYPSKMQNAIIGFILMFILAVGIILLREIFDLSVRTEEDIQRACRYPVLAHVPDMTVQNQSKGHGIVPKKATALAGKQPVVGRRMGFAASEAYKLLRTKLLFSFAGEDECRVIGVSSALSGEGKSLTAINLAHTIATLNKRVLLVDCDMRRPTLAEKLRIEKAPGLSNFLTGQNNLESVIQEDMSQAGETCVQVITAGQNPPNPVELLSSAKMAAMLTVSRTKYDYIILDLPPVEEVSDAMAIAGRTDGMLLVVRQNYCNRHALTDSVQQFEFMDAKILGVVFNFVAENGPGEGYGKYGKYGKYSKYGKYGKYGRYGRKYYYYRGSEAAPRKGDDANGKEAE